MERICIIIKLFMATSGEVFGYFLGGWDTTLRVLLIMSIIDYTTGMIAGWINGKLKSKIGFKGIAKKVVLFLLVGAAIQIDIALGVHSTMREATIFFFMGNELLSILENAGRIGIPLPQALTNALEILNGKQKNENNKGENE